MSKFEIEGLVKYPPRGIGFKLEERETGAKGKEFVTLHELLCFDKPIMAQLQQGDRVRVQGRIGRRQVKDAKRHADNGMEYDVWTPQLIVTAVFPSGDSETPIERQTRHRTERVRSDSYQDRDDGDDVPF